MRIVYASIGNSDNRLTQAEWSAYAYQFEELVRRYATQVHGVWYSESTRPWQNGMAGFELHDVDDPIVRKLFADLARSKGQDSIAWLSAPAESVVFL